MNGLIRGAIHNTPAMNTLMVAILVAGLFSLFNLRREVFPEFELETILISVPYPGASPDEVETGICEKIEESVRSIDGIKKVTSVAKEGSGSVILELNTGTNSQKILNEVRSEVDRITSFPELAEDAEVKQVVTRQPAITVGVIGPDLDSVEAELQLREVAEQVRNDLIRLPAVSQADISGAKDYQIDIEISEETLRRYGLSLKRVAEIVRKENLELPAGTIRTESQEILVKGKNKRTIGEEIARIPLVTLPDGTVLTIDDLGDVRDEFADSTVSTVIDGQPGIAISVTRSSTEDLLKMTDAVHEYLTTHQMPSGYRLIYWGDRSVEVRDRLDLLAENGMQGLLLVLIFLSLFLNLRLAWWVSLGIPISILGACGALYLGGETLNMLSSFTFVMALGIVVDDAIVVGENVHAHRLMGKSPLQAAIDGTVEVAPSVAASVSTTIIAFLPLLFVTGVMGKFVAVMPIGMIAILLFSLFESLFILSCHLAHEADETLPQSYPAKARRFREKLPRGTRWTVGTCLLVAGYIAEVFAYPVRQLNRVVNYLNGGTQFVMDKFVNGFYLPMLNLSLSNTLSTACVAVTLLMLTAGLVAGGFVPFIVFPKTDSNTIEATITYPDGTPVSMTHKGTAQLEAGIREVNEQLEQEGQPVVELIRRSVGFATMQNGPAMSSENSGSHLGLVTVELKDVSERELNSQQILAAWRKAAGEFPGVENLSFGDGEMGPAGTPIEFKLLAQGEDFDDLQMAVEQTKARLAEFPGVFDIQDDSSAGKWEFQLQVKDSAVATGINLEQLAETVRASYYGEEVMRLQRGRHEVKLMVRFPEGDRHSLAEFDQIRVRTDDGVEYPLTELAEVQVSRSYSEINRVDQMRSITISADLDETRANASQIVGVLRQNFMPGLLEQYPDVDVLWEGQQQQTTESVQSLLLGLAVALLAMFVLLTFQFTSYVQPIVIMGIIPFGVVGAVVGHAVMGLPITLFSLFGLVTLTGIVVNDSIVLIDFINHRVNDGMPLREALVDAGRRRLRPILLTSVTTVAGLFPLILETSFQAQILIPMAVSICFGLIVSTLLILLLVPTFYYAIAQVTRPEVVTAS
ncbi:efflux RND transporter permease subunit [Rubinisphaera margarita]|uniref:efflux RND transporter permease subunit n=1 Tax=Rubinisphaera margarita TaxID=2909586 RepID=UPI001EE87F52|nr:efflux RND transporter permease subunit [Rubinisphaera margarita]MCG6158261.1 efflux RND transporter permease subunit [Rubinisphaera margarita]